MAGLSTDKVNQINGVHSSIVTVGAQVCQYLCAVYYLVKVSTVKFGTWRSFQSVPNAGSTNVRSSTWLAMK